MATAMFAESRLVSLFREFYLEIIRLKRLVRMEAWSRPAAVEEGEEPGQEGTQSIDAIWQRLLNLLRQQELSAGRISGDYLFEFYKEAQFIMAALADDIFLHLDWPGKDIWENNLLETKLFNSHSAGEKFFEKLDRLLRTRETVYVDLAKLYLLAISLGFEGKYRGLESGKEAVENYRLQLFQFIKQREPQLETEAYRLFPQAYEHTLDQGKEKRLPHPRGWVMGLGVLVVGLYLVSHGIWVQDTSELKDILAQILAIK